MKNLKKHVDPKLIWTLAGVAAGTLIATEPRRMANKTALELEDIFGDDDIELTRRQIRETLNGSVEEEIPAELPLVTEDAVEEEAEAIAADFME